MSWIILVVNIIMLVLSCGVLYGMFSYYTALTRLEAKLNLDTLVRNTSALTLKLEEHVKALASSAKMKTSEVERLRSDLLHIMEKERLTIHPTKQEGRDLASEVLAGEWLKALVIVKTMMKPPRSNQNLGRKS